MRTNSAKNMHCGFAAVRDNKSEFFFYLKQSVISIDA